MSENKDRIYHLVIESELHAQTAGGLYRPLSLASEGFVHCSHEPSVIPVANDYYADVDEKLLLLIIDTAKLTSEVRYEAAAPLPGGGRAHLEDAPQFPHIYGPIDVAAIAGVGVLGLSTDGYLWPSSFLPFEPSSE